MSVTYLSHYWRHSSSSHAQLFMNLWNKYNTKESSALFHIINCTVTRVACMHAWVTRISRKLRRRVVLKLFGLWQCEVAISVASFRRDMVIQNFCSSFLRDAGFFFKSATWPRVSEWRCRRSRAMRTWSCQGPWQADILCPSRYEVQRDNGRYSTRKIRYSRTAAHRIEEKKTLEIVLLLCYA